MAEDVPSIITPEHLAALDKKLGRTRSLPTLYRAIVNAPFENRLLTTSIDLGILVYLQVNKQNGTIDRVALSDTELAKGAVSVSAKPFHDIRIPRNAKNNSIVNVIKTGTHALTDDWRCMFTPILTPEEARRNQMAASIECSMIWPLKAGDGGAMIFSFYQPLQYIGKDHENFASAYVQLVDKHLARLFT